MIVIFLYVLHVFELCHLLLSVVRLESTSILLDGMEEFLVEVFLVLHGSIDSQEANQLDSIGLDCFYFQVVDENSLIFLLLALATHQIESVILSTHLISLFVFIGRLLGGIHRLIESSHLLSLPFLEVLVLLLPCLQRSLVIFLLAFPCFCQLLVLFILLYHLLLILVLRSLLFALLSLLNTFLECHHEVILNFLVLQQAFLFDL